MRILYLGDLVGRTGREAVIDLLPSLREKLRLEFVVVNGENAAGGFGISPKICSQLFESGVDVVTLGNHAWDCRDILPYIDGESRLIRPANYPIGTPGRGIGEFLVDKGAKIVVLQVMGRIFMDPLDDPFSVVDKILQSYRLGTDVTLIFVDIHGEATSEKMALAHYLDGRVSCVFGTHTHVPTADVQILSGGTAFMSDVGMCGDYDSVIGMDKDEPIRRFVRKFGDGRFSPAQGDATVCGVFLDVDDETGLARYVAPLRQGGKLQPAWPEVEQSE